MTSGALVATVMIPLMGLLSDKVGRQKMYTLSVVLLGLFIVPWFLLLDTGTGWGIMLATTVAFGILWAPVTAVLGTLCSEIFSANVRYTDHPRLPAGRRARGHRAAYRHRSAGEI